MSNTNALFAKSYTLLDKLRYRIEQIDDIQFPTDVSSEVKKYLLDTIELLCHAPEKQNPEPSVFYSKVVRFQELVGFLEKSSSDFISWPVVSFCNELWDKIFDDKDKDVQVFFSLYQIHNYGILCFSELLSIRLKSVIPSCNETPKQPEIWCLFLATLEEDNIPLYANIGHEFGHVIFGKQFAPLFKYWEEQNNDLMSSLRDQIDLSSKDHITRNLRKSKLNFIFHKLLGELTSDIVGCLLFGPSFYLSLQEMSWEFWESFNDWKIILTPHKDYIKAYPSFKFRLETIKELCKFSEFAKNLNEELKQSSMNRIKNIDFLDSPKDSPSFLPADIERVVINPSLDKDSNVLKKIIEKNLDLLKVSIKDYCDYTKSFLEKKLNLVVYDYNPNNIIELLRRLELGIIPNIIPENKNLLLGIPPDFPEILLAASVYRKFLLSKWDSENKKGIAKELEVIEQLTIKAFEVTYIQKEYNEWEVKYGDS